MLADHTVEEFHVQSKCVNCAQTRPIADLTLCSECDRTALPRQYFCLNHCQKDSCEHARNCDLKNHLSCWQDAHSVILPKLQENHQKLNALHDDCIQVIMPPKMNDDTQRRLHELEREAK